MTDQLDRQWWKEAVVYQIYPRSFNDSDGDGIGDLPGIIEKVEYLDEIGVDVVWLNPVYESPMADNGYDISDYRSVHPVFGSMDDWEHLLARLHARDIRLIMDLVINHTSDEHEWFQRSERRKGKYEEYYYWADGSPETPPNNWQSLFGGSAWSYSWERNQWYLHLFDEKQPDLNWRSADVRDDIKSMMAWWLEKGIDGFRIDALTFLSKTAGLPDGDPTQTPIGKEHFIHGPNLYEYIRELSREVFSDYDSMTVGEMDHTSLEQASRYLGDDGAGLDMIFHFLYTNVDDGPDGPWDFEEWGKWDLREFKRIVTRCQDELFGTHWDALFLGNHDLPRIVSRFGDDELYRSEAAKLLATFLLTMRGTPFIYQGDEIGMTNSDFRSLDEIDDPMTIGKVEELLSEGVIDSYDEVRELVNHRSRDHGRTPMQWSETASAGFTEGEEWLGINRNYHNVNVVTELATADSIWRHYQQLIELRHEKDVLVYGEYELLLPDHEQIYSYTRSLSGEAILIVLNWSVESATFNEPTVETNNSEILYSNYECAPDEPNGSELRPYEAIVYRLER